MTTTALIEPPVSAEASDTQPGASHLPDSGELPPLLSLVPVAGPPVWVFLGFGLVLPMLLVPPFALLATLMGVALLGATALVALVVLAGAILRAPFLLVRRLRGHWLRPFSLPVSRFREVKVRRV